MMLQSKKTVNFIVFKSILITKYKVVIKEIWGHE